MKNVTRFRRSRSAVEVTGALIAALAFVTGAMGGAYWPRPDASPLLAYAQHDQVACLIASAN